MTIKLGIAPINWCNDDDPNLGKEITFAQCISEMAEAGYVGTEIGNKYPRDPVELNNALTPLGLTISSAWFSAYFTEPDKYQATLSRFLAHLSFMRALNAKYINVCECGHAIQNTETPVFGDKKPVFTSTQWKSLINGLHQMGRIANEVGVKLVYHYHAGTGVFLQNEIDYLMQHTSPPLVSLLLDTGHAVIANVDPIELIERYAQRIHYVHLKDVRLPVFNDAMQKQYHFMDAVRAGMFTVPGDGGVDFAGIIALLRKLNYQGWMLVEAEQDPAKAPPLEFARKAHDYISGLLCKNQSIKG